MSRTQTLREWARDEFTDPIPSYPTLLKYAQAGMITPPPFKAGRCWRVDKNARFVGMAIKPPVKESDDPRLKRIMEDGAAT